MSAVFKPADSLEARFELMTHADLPQVTQVEQSAYKYPWTHDNFSDSLNSGYQAQMLLGGQASVDTPAQLLGYFVAMKGVDEVHLLNLTVAPAYQSQGWGRLLLDGLVLWSRGQGAQWLWLEVRASNAHAKALYVRYGFREVGLRKGYYPEGGTSLLGGSVRESAVVMSLALAKPAS
jgi:ribosomal-protein-alanine N-acetyltransferase